MYELTAEEYWNSHPNNPDNEADEESIDREADLRYMEMIGK